VIPSTLRTSVITVVIAAVGLLAAPVAAQPPRHQPLGDAVATDPEDVVPKFLDLRCSAIRRKMTLEEAERVERWAELGLIRESDCWELGRPDPKKDRTLSEELDEKHPPKRVLDAVPVVYDAYRDRPYMQDSLGYAVSPRANLALSIDY
jgi:hypothetical protein